MTPMSRFAIFFGIFVSFLQLAIIYPSLPSDLRAEGLVSVIGHLVMGVLNFVIWCVQSLFVFIFD